MYDKKKLNIPNYKIIIVIIVNLLLLSCMSNKENLLSPPNNTIITNPIQPPLDLTLAILPAARSDYPIELEKFCSLLHNILSSKVNVYRFDNQEMPSVILPDESEIFLRLANANADILLEVKLEFQEASDTAIADTTWLYAIAQVQLQDPVHKTVLWQDAIRSEKGIIHWPKSGSSHWKAMEQLAHPVADAILKKLPELPRTPANHIKFLATTDSTEDLRQIQLELLRLSKAKYFQIVGTPTVLSCLLTTTLDYSGDLLQLKLLFEDVCQSLGLQNNIKISRRLLILEIYH